MRDFYDVFLIILGISLSVAASVQMFDFVNFAIVSATMVTNFINVSVVSVISVISQINIHILSVIKIPIDDGGWFYHYQTFFAALIALAGALVTGLIMKSNHDDLIERQRRAAKAHMHDAASELCSYCQECLKYLMLDRGNILPDKPIDDIKVFKDNIAFLDNVSSKAIVKLVEEYQVHNSNLEEYEHVSVEHSKYKDQILRLITLHAYVLRVFGYARDKELEINSSKPEEDEMHSTLKQLVGINEYFNNITKYQHIDNIIEEKFRNSP